jgi:hypothetical protein
MILVQVERIIQIMEILLLIVVVTGKEKIPIKSKNLFVLLVHHRKHQHLIIVEEMMVMHKNVFRMLKQYQVISFLIKIPMYVHGEMKI